MATDKTTCDLPEGGKSADTAPEATCPICARPGSGNLHDNGWGVTSAHYLDDAGHIWSTRWLTMQGGAA